MCGSSLFFFLNSSFIFNDDGVTYRTAVLAIPNVCSVALTDFFPFFHFFFIHSWLAFLTKTASSCSWWFILISQVKPRAQTKNRHGQLLIVSTKTDNLGKKMGGFKKSAFFRQCQLFLLLQEMTWIWISGQEVLVTFWSCKGFCLASYFPSLFTIFLLSLLD